MSPPTSKPAGRRGLLVRTFGRRWLAIGFVVALTIGACATVPSQEHLLVPQGEDRFATTVQTCTTDGGESPAALKVAATAGTAGAASVLRPLDPARFRVANWNLHKAQDKGWQADLARFAAESDLLLLQEAVMTPEVARVLRAAGLRWRMAGAFAFDGVERGVLVAARADPVQVCTMRAFEPLFPLPKAALVARFRLADGRMLAVANLHSVNFTLGLARFTDQLTAVADQLAAHDGPMVWAGDFNAWSDDRTAIMEGAARRLGLTGVRPVPDLRRSAFGFPLDHVMHRGFGPAQARTEKVKSSDHNPMLIELPAS